MQPLCGCSWAGGADYLGGWRAFAHHRYLGIRWILRLPPLKGGSTCCDGHWGPDTREVDMWPGAQKLVDSHCEAYDGNNQRNVSLLLCTGQHWPFGKMITKTMDLLVTSAKVLSHPGLRSLEGWRQTTGLALKTFDLIISWERDDGIPPLLGSTSRVLLPSDN